MSTEARRIAAWSVGAVCLAVVIWLVATAVFDLPRGDSTASVVGAVVGVIGLALSAATLLTNPAATGTWSRGRRISKVRAHGRGSIAAGGDVRGNAIGARSKVTGPAIAPANHRPAGRGTHDVSARGTGALGAAGDITDNAIGEGSEQ
ncbi:hypothetical protein [Streptomyces galbus]|uniref:Secreted protein n=1 Tax=Streptomyces galbus TaxID=33898 RepID=A0ABX1IIX4_STRGB|nr:hypothetical protein [Streptomyces galbus]NKQ24137.1 hypothetical protein [Streptomyces galbus]